MFTGPPSNTLNTTHRSRHASTDGGPTTWTNAQCLGTACCGAQRRMEDTASLPLLQVIFLLVLASGYFSTIVSGSLLLVPSYLIYLAILIVALVLVAIQCCRLVAGAAAANVAAWLPVLLLQTWLPPLQQVGHRHRCSTMASSSAAACFLPPMLQP